MMLLIAPDILHGTGDWLT